MKTLLTAAVAFLVMFLVGLGAAKMFAPGASDSAGGMAPEVYVGGAGGACVDAGGGGTGGVVL